MKQGDWLVHSLGVSQTTEELDFNSQDYNYNVKLIVYK